MGQAQALEGAGRDHDVGGGEGAGDVVDGAGQPDIVVERERGRGRTDLVQHGVVARPSSAAHDDQLGPPPAPAPLQLAARGGEDVRQQGQALLWPRVRDGDEDEVIGSETQAFPPVS